MVESILVPIMIVAGIGLAAGIILSIATIIFNKPGDEKEEALREALPGINCGACGFSGCDGYAKAMAEGAAGAELCIPGGSDTREQLSVILGVEAGAYRREAAFVRCNGSCAHTSTKMDYTGAATCYGASQIFGGPESCQYGCMGYGDCVAVCAYDAIHVIDGVAVVDPIKCVGCLKCVAACPKQLIQLLAASDTALVACANHDKGGGVRKICSVGCITCNRCVKSCPSEAITMDREVAVVDPARCTDCGACIEACPQNCIVKMKN